MNEILSKISIGTANFGHKYGISNKKEQIKEKEIHRALNFAYMKGINKLDTAKAYGLSEEVIGDYIEKNPDKKWEVSTKISKKRKSIKDQLNDSIEKLEIKPNIVLAHSVENYIQRNFFDEFMEAKNELKINKIGVSIYDINGRLANIACSFAVPANPITADD